MASRIFARLTDPGPLVPSMGTLGSAANQYFPKGTIVTRNASGNAVSPSTADASGLPAVGMSSASYDNRTGSEAGGTAGDLDVEVKYGVFGWDISGTTPIPGDTLYVVDNQTVSTDSAGGTRGEAGVCSEVRTMPGHGPQAFCWMGPHVASEAFAEAGSLATTIPVSALKLSTGAAVPAFSDGVADGFSLVDSEAFGLRINDDSTTTFAIGLSLVDHDGGDLVLGITGFRVGSADATATITVGAFFQTLGAAHTADANAGGSTTAFDGATTIVTEETLTIAAADVPTAPCFLTLTFTVAAALDDDDLVILGMRLSGAKALF